jgi:hypothetical protein
MSDRAGVRILTGVAAVVGSCQLAVATTAAAAAHRVDGVTAVFEMHFAVLGLKVWLVRCNQGLAQSVGHVRVLTL